MPTNQGQRNLIARMKLIPVDALIRGKSLLLIDDSIVRGTQLGETTEFLYQSGAKEVHIRPACPPLMFGCPYLNFSRSSSELDLITRRIIRDREGDDVSEEVLLDYANPDSQNYKEMVEEIRKRLNFTTLRFHRLDDLVESIGLSPCKLCTCLLYTSTRSTFSSEDLSTIITSTLPTPSTWLKISFTRASSCTS